MRPPRTWLTFPWEILTVLGAAIVLALVLVVLPLGLLAANLLDTAAPYPVLLSGGEPPVPYRAFVALQGLMPYLALGAAVAAVVHVGLRRLLKRTRAFGDDLVWDAIVSPLVLGAATAAVWLLVAGVRARGLPSADEAAVIGLASLAGAAVLGAVGLACGLLARSSGVRRVATVVVVLLALAPLARVTADAWGSSRLRTLEREVEPELVAERQRLLAVRTPALGEPTLDDDAAPRYRALIARIDLAYDERAAFGKAASAGPQLPLSANAARLFAREQALLPELHEALRCNRCVWGLEPAAPNEPVLNMLSMRTLGDLLLVEGHALAQKGDAAGAVHRYAEAVRLGEDLSGGALLHNLVGGSIASGGLAALGGLLVSSAHPPVAEVTAGLAQVEGRLPGPDGPLRRQRLLVLGGLSRVTKADDVFGVPPVLPLVVPYRLLVAQAARAIDPRWRALERGDAVPDPGPTWNPVFRYIALDDLARGRQRFAVTAARLALVHGALVVEAAGGAGHGYPAGDALALPRDPLAAAGVLHYLRAGDDNGYRLWSVGENGVDDGGTAKDSLDLVLERGSSPSRR